MSFLSIFYFVLDIQTKSQMSFFYVSHFFVFTVLLFSFFIFFSFHSFKHWRTYNIHVNIPCKLLSPPVLVDSTHFSHYAITEVPRKPKHTHFKSSFQNIHFLCAVFRRSCINLQHGIGWTRRSGQEEGEIWHHYSPLWRSSWLCSRKYLRTC